MRWEDKLRMRLFLSLLEAFLSVSVFASATDQQVCARCHPREADNYQRSAMAHSVAAPAEVPAGRFTHKLSGSTIEVLDRKGAMIHRLMESGLKAEYPVAYQVGSGIVGHSYLVRAGDFLFQSPASYYTHRGVWDLTPGYEPERQLDFNHEILSGCLFCHTGEVRLIQGSNNRYQDPPFTSISCERCHGPGSGHSKHPSAANIVNPAKLPTRARDSVCEQCHLEGETRILNPGKDWWDFRAGQELEQTFSVYLPNGEHGVKAVSHAEQLAESQCARQSSGKLWCGTCHDPHGDASSNRKAQVSRTCRSCHRQLSQAAHAQEISECVTCHMPARSATDVAHAATTDHRIRRRPGLEFEARDTGAGMPVAWREPEPSLRQRNLALAALAVAQQQRSAKIAREAVHLLLDLPAPVVDDPEVLSALGSVMLQQQRPKEALQLFSSALQRKPSNASFALYLGIAYASAGDRANAMRALERAIQIDPSLERAYLELAKIDQNARVQTLDRYLKLFPQSIAVRLARGLH